MEAKEGEGRSEAEECTEIIHTSASETLETSVIFHVLKEIVGFVLYMHQQIPAILPDITLEYDAMRAECKDLELVLSEPEVKSSCRRKHIGRMRELKQGIKKLDKLMSSFSSIQTALQLILNETHDIERVILVLGASPIRPQHVYRIHFLHGRVVMENEKDYVKSRAADTLSRKAIRALISNGAGSVSYVGNQLTRPHCNLCEGKMFCRHCVSGPTKLFLLVKAPATLNLPLHFLPKRDFKYSKKIVPFRLRIKCKVTNQDVIGVTHHASESTGSMSFPDSTSNDLIWFQCRHTIKGLPSRAPLPEE